MSHSLVLASTSSYRKELLSRLRLPFQCHPHQCDERALSRGKRFESFDDNTTFLAQEKAQSLRETFSHSWIIGSDQIAEQEGEQLHKPGNRENAIEQISKLAGSSHRLLTALCLLGPEGQAHTEIVVHTMMMRTLSRAEIERYVDADQPFDCAGSYKIEGLGISLFDSIAGDDFTAIVGLPLLLLSSMLRKAGFEVP